MAGGCLFSICVFLLLFIPYRPIQLISLIVTALTGISFLISKVIPRSLEIKRTPGETRLFHGQKSRQGITIKNPFRFRINNILLIDRGPDLYLEKGGEYLVSLEPRAAKEVHSPVIARRRGAYKIGPLTLSGTDPLGFFPWEKEIDLLDEIVVYPAFFPLESLLKTGISGGNISSINPVYEDTTRIRSLRNYRPGDSPRRIHWKATARTGELQTMEYSNTLKTPLILLLQLDPGRYPRKHRYQNIERALETAASCAVDSLKKKQLVSLFTNGTIKDSTPGKIEAKDPTQAPVILETLARLEPAEEATPLIESYLIGQSPASAGSRLILITPSLNEEELKQLEKLKKKRISILLYRIGPASKDPIPYPSWQVTEYGENILTR